MAFGLFYKKKRYLTNTIIDFDCDFIHYDPINLTIWKSALIYQLT